MTPDSTRKLALAPAISSLLAQLRRRVRAYIWVEGIAVLVVVFAASFWLSLALDWLFEPPEALRIFVLIALAAGLAYVSFRWIFHRAFVPLNDRSLALVLERRFHKFQDSLLTSVEIATLPDRAEPFNPEMLAATHEQALAATANLPLGEVFNARPLVRRIVLAVLLLASMIGFGVAASNAFGVWVRRNLLLSNELWPRATHLLVEGFESRSSVKIARGSDLSLVVKADAAPGREVPEIVEVRYSTKDGARSRETMNREGVATPGRESFQRYAYQFKSVLTDIDFFVLGGDDRVGPLHLEVVDSPTISQMIVHCEYPEYMKLSPRDIPVAGMVQVPCGARLTIRAQANKRLSQVQIDDLTEEEKPITHKLQLSATREFEFALPVLESDKTLLFTLVDDDHIRSRDPIRLTLSASPDEPPQVSVQLHGIGTAITARAILPAAGEITDDYGVAKIWFEHHVDETAPRRQAIGSPPQGQTKVEVKDSLDIESLKLQPKQKFHLIVQAEDTFGLGPAPHQGLSQRYVLDVVTPEQLRSMLEARELMLRRRCETIIQEMTDTREILTRIELGAASAPSTPAANDKKPATPSQASPAKPAAGGAEPGDEPEGRAANAPKSAEQTLSLQRVRAERVLQNSQRSANEVINLATAFDDIREELINNRVDTEELKTRLKAGIADPLRDIGEKLFPELESRLKQMEGRLTDSQAGTQAQQAAIAQADVILVALKQVLNKMLELETFNEVLDILRGIIENQEKVNAETKERQKQRLRNLLD